VSEQLRLVRFVVAIQRRPAASALVVYAALVLVGLCLPSVENDFMVLGLLTFAACASTALADVLPPTSSTWTRVAVVGLAFGASLPLTIAAVGDDAAPRAVAIVGAYVGLPQVSTAIARRHDFDGRRTRAIALLIVVTTLAIAVAVPHLDPRGIAVVLLWALAVQLAFEAAAAGALPFPIFTGCAFVVGVLLGSMNVGAPEPHPEFRTATTLVVGWTAGALLLPLARTGRRLTAVPDDHPIRADFGNARL
jgi:hypothetical protein